MCSCSDKIFSKMQFSRKIGLISRRDSAALHVSTVLSRTHLIDWCTQHALRVCLPAPKGRVLASEGNKDSPQTSQRHPVFRVKWWNRYGYSACMNNQISAGRWNSVGADGSFWRGFNERGDLKERINVFVSEVCFVINSPEAAVAKVCRLESFRMKTISNSIQGFRLNSFQRYLLTWVSDYFPGMLVYVIHF